MLRHWHGLVDKEAEQGYTEYRLSSRHLEAGTLSKVTLRGEAVTLESLFIVAWIYEVRVQRRHALDQAFRCNLFR